MVSALHLARIDLEEKKKMNEELSHSEAAQFGQAVNITVQILLQRNQPINLESVKKIVFEEVYPMLCTLRKEFVSRKQHFEDVKKEEDDKMELEEIENKMVNLIGENVSKS